MSNTEQPPALRNITISTTLACNQGCAHCWVDAGPAQSVELDSAEICAILLEAKSLGAQHVKFTGGEPLLNKDIGIIIEYAAGLDYRISIETNGTLLSCDRLDALEDHLGRLHFYVSLDGATADIHDNFRRQRGAFMRTTNNLEALRERDGYFSVHTVVRRGNIDEIVRLHEQVRALGASQHKLILAIHDMGRGVDVSSDQVTPDEIFELLDQLPKQRFWDYGWNPRRSRDTVLMTTLPPAFQPTGPTVTCGWSESFVSVLANGDVALCQGLYGYDEAKAGNLREQTLSELWTASELFVTSRMWTGSDLSGICHNCAVATSCRGLCRASAISTYRDLRAPYPFCQNMYDAGRFPQHMVLDSEYNSFYTPPPVSKPLPIYPLGK